VKLKRNINIVAAVTGIALSLASLGAANASQPSLTRGAIAFIIAGCLLGGLFVLGIEAPCSKLRGMRSLSRFKQGLAGPTPDYKFIEFGKLSKRYRAYKFNEFEKRWGQWREFVRHIEKKLRILFCFQ